MMCCCEELITHKLVWLQVLSGLITDPWRDSGSGRAGFGFAALPLQCFTPSCVYP